MDSWNHPEEIGTSHLQCWHREWTDGEATHRSVASKRSPFTWVHIKRDRWLLVLWASYSCSGRQSSSANSSSKTVRGRTKSQSSSTNSSSKTVRGRTMLPSVTASSPRKVHPWKLLLTKKGRNYSKGGGNVVEVCLISYFCMYQELYFAEYIYSCMLSYRAFVCWSCLVPDILIPFWGLLIAWWIVLCHLYMTGL